MSIYEKLSHVQQKLKAPKNHYNDYGGYKYRNAEDILQAVKPLLAEQGLTMTITDNLVQIGDRYYIKATVTIVDIEENETHEVNGFAREEENKKGMDSMQLSGATSSYARKYALNGMFAIDDTKDSDATNKHGKGKNNNKGNNTNKSNNNYKNGFTGLQKTIYNEYKRDKKRVKKIIVNFFKNTDYELKSIGDIKKLSTNQTEALLQKIQED